MKPRTTLKWLAMVVVVLLFTVSSVMSYLQHTETSRLVSAAVKTGAWAASELESELLKFENTLVMVGLNEKKTDDLVLRFDLLWSRLEVLSTGRETAGVRALEGAAPLLQGLNTLVRDIEEKVISLQAGDKAATVELVERLAPFKREVREFNVRAFVGSEARTKVIKSFEERESLSISMFGLLGSGAILIILLMRESARNRLQSLNDPLTDLPNRKAFQEALSLAALDSGRKQIAILVIDLDNFKEVNDTHGHDSGDLLLQATAMRLKNSISVGDTVARLGGDEFAIIQHDVVEAEDAARLARRICEQLGQPLTLNNQVIYPSASIGVSVYPEDASKLNQVMVNADMAMYRSKQDRGISYRMYEPEMNASLQRAKRLAEDLRGALRNNELILNYQPIVRFKDRSIESVEALLRWHHPEYGYVPPPEIVSVAEQSGQARELNEWVIRQSCLQYRAWSKRGLPPIKVAVNISPAMYTQHDIVESLTRIIGQTRMDASKLVIEVTEDTTMRDIDTSPDTMLQMKELGVTIALDDFGTGYSSLSHLKCLPIDKLKIDRSFVQDLNNLPKDMRFIRSIISLADSLGIDLVAEGIEFESNLIDLRHEGCKLGQGYLFSKAVSSGEIEDMLVKQQIAAKAATSFDYVI